MIVYGFTFRNSSRKMPEPLRLHGIMFVSARLNKVYLCITLFDLKYNIT